MSNQSSSYLSSARYGKTNIRVFRVVRNKEWHHVVEYFVELLVEGEISPSYTQADNSVIVATDSLKNITHYVAKKSPYVLVPEKFAVHLGTHIVSKYSHLRKAFVTINQLRWARIPVGGKDHTHAFYRDGDDKRIIKAEIDASAGKDKIIAKVSAGITDLLVVKTTGSSFSRFVRDEYTTLAEVDDRIFSTSIDLTYNFTPIPIPAPKDEAKLEFVAPPSKGNEGSLWDEDLPERARKITLEIFAIDDSASVQATLYKMAQKIVEENAPISSVSYILPNKHYIPVDMKYIGVDNTSPAEAEVFLPIEHPSGLISATVSRK